LIGRDMGNLARIVGHGHDGTSSLRCLSCFFMLVGADPLALRGGLMFVFCFVCVSLNTRLSIVFWFSVMDGHLMHSDERYLRCFLGSFFWERVFWMAIYS
jgi:hypothetical protein